MAGTLHGVPLSQPFRAVAWTCLRHRLPFKTTLVVPGQEHKRGSRNPDYLKHTNPTGTVPFLQTNHNHSLPECAAILTYLAKTHNWEKIYPNDPTKASHIDAYLHWHHTNTRKLAIAFWAPNVKPDVKVDDMVISSAKEDSFKALHLIESYWLGESEFIGGQKDPSAADHMAYEEIGQLSPRFANLIDLEPFPKVRTWLERMEARLVE